MPLTYNDGTDDPLVYDGSASFAGGQDSQADPSMIGPDQCANLVNTVLSRIGSIQTRKGISRLIPSPIAASKVQGMMELDTSTIAKILVACNGAMYQISGFTVSDATGYKPMNTTVNVEMAQGANLIYVVDGFQNMSSWDGTTFTDLGTGSPAPPIASLLTWHTNRLFASGNNINNDTVWVSNILDASATGWNYSLRSFRVGGGEGDAIASIFSWLNYKLLVFKRNSFYVVESDPSVNVADWIIHKVSDTIGCLSQRSVAMVGNDVYFLSRDGVRSVMRTQMGQQNEVSLPLSWPIQPLIDRINWGAANTACAIYFDNKYILAAPLDGATTPNTVLVYDTRVQRWLGSWTGWTPQIFLLSKLNAVKRLLFGNAYGLVMKWNDTADEDVDATYLDDGISIATTIKTRAYRFNEPLSPKAGWNVDLEFVKSLATARLQSISDQGGEDTVSNNLLTQDTRNQIPLTLPFDLASISNARRAFDISFVSPFREIQFQLLSKSGKLSLKTLAASAFLNTMEYER